MQTSINNLNFLNYTKHNDKRKTERGELMYEFLQNLNLSRAGKFAPLTFSRMGKLLEGIPTDALYALKAKCKEAGELAQNKRKFATEEQRKKMNTYDSAYSKAFYWNIRPHNK